MIANKINKIIGLYLLQLSLHYYFLHVEVISHVCSLQ